LQTKVDLNQARFWFEKAKAQDELRAQYELALMNLLVNDEQTQKYGLQLLKDAAFKGNPHAEYTYGLLSEVGFKDSKGKTILALNLEQAKNMFRLASVNDFGLAKFRLAEWMSREPLSNLSLTQRFQKQLEIRSLYAEAVKNGIDAAKLPLAFYLAASKDSEKRQWALHTAQEFAEKGNEEAALLAGLMIDRDTQNSNRMQEALQWYAKAKKHPIGGFVWASLSPQQDKVKWYLNQAAQMNFSYAYLNLAVIAHQEHQPSLDYLQKAVTLGNPMAGHLLANQSVLNGHEQDLKQSVDIFQKLAGKGDLEAQTKLAYLMIHGLGTAQNLELGQQYLLDAASHHYIPAQFLLGQMYHIGSFKEGVNDEAAKYWFSQAAKTDAASSINLGFIYETVDKSYGQALQAYQKALPSFKFKSNYNVGLIYQYGKGMSMDTKAAELSFTKAMNAGSKRALIALGDLYLYKSNSKENQQQALKWFEKAAKFGQADAFYRLGLLYETGIGTDVNYPLALSYYQKAANQGDVRAEKALERFNTYHLMSTEHSSKNMSAVGQWFKGYFGTQEKVKGKNFPVELQYLGVLETFNQGQQQEAIKELINIVKDYPYYAPAKNMIMQMQEANQSSPHSV
jgi:enhanced entry protein EnhC